MTTPKIASYETEIRGKWTLVRGRVEADDECRRIEQLIAEHLQEVERDATGWDRLFFDSHDGRYCELNCPESELDGGTAMLEPPSGVGGPSQVRPSQTVTTLIHGGSSR